MIFFALTYSDLYSEVVFTENIYQRPAAEGKNSNTKLDFYERNSGLIQSKANA